MRACPLEAFILLCPLTARDGGFLLSCVAPGLAWLEQPALAERLSSHIVSPCGLLGFPHSWVDPE